MARFLMALGRRGAMTSGNWYTVTEELILDSSKPVWLMGSAWRWTRLEILFLTVNGFMDIELIG